MGGPGVPGPSRNLAPGRECIPASRATGGGLLFFFPILSKLSMALHLSDIWRIAVACALAALALVARAQVSVSVESPSLPSAPSFAAPSSFSTPFSYPREQTRLDITLMAAADLNPDDKGRAAPIMVRIYELRSEAGFESADYFTLLQHDKALIGSDLLVREEFIMRPGDVKTIRRKSHPDLAAIGVLAGYRDLAHADWRAVQKLEPAPEAAWYRAVLPSKKVRLQIELQAQGVRLTPLH